MFFLTQLLEAFTGLLPSFDDVPTVLPSFYFYRVTECAAGERRAVDTGGFHQCSPMTLLPSFLSLSVSLLTIDILHEKRITAGRFPRRTPTALPSFARLDSIFDHDCCLSSFFFFVAVLVESWPFFGVFTSSFCLKTEENDA